MAAKYLDATAKAEQPADFRREREVDEDIKSLTAPDPKVRRAAVDRLGEAREVRALNDLLRVLHQDVEPSCRAVAAWAIGRLGDPSAVVALNRSISGDPDERVRREAYASLSRVNETESIRTSRVKVNLLTKILANVSSLSRVNETGSIRTSRVKVNLLTKILANIRGGIRVAVPVLLWTFLGLISVLLSVSLDVLPTDNCRSMWHPGGRCGISVIRLVYSLIVVVSFVKIRALIDLQWHVGWSRWWRLMLIGSIAFLFLVMALASFNSPPISLHFGEMFLIFLIAICFAAIMIDKLRNH